MLIDWFTVFAQIVNFLILVWLLKRFLYGPIIAAMDEREEKIASRLREAARQGAEAEAEAAAYREKNRELESVREKLLEAAKKEVEEKRKEFLREARGEVDRIREIWEDELRRDRDMFLRRLRQRTAERIIEILRKALSGMANAQLEGEVVKAFLGRLEHLTGEEKKAIEEALAGEGKTIVVASAFDMPAALQKEVGDRISRIAGGAVARFEKSEGMIMGIEVEADERKIIWSLDGYLKGLEEDLLSAISEGAVMEKGGQGGIGG